MQMQLLVSSATGVWQSIPSSSTCDRLDMFKAGEFYSRRWPLLCGCAIFQIMDPASDPSHQAHQHCPIKGFLQDGLTKSLGPNSESRDSLEVFIPRIPSLICFAQLARLNVPPVLSCQKQQIQGLEARTNV